MGNLALSIVAAAVLIGGYAAIQSKDIKAKNVLIQTKSALTYEKSIKKEDTTNYAKFNVKPSMLFVTNNTKDKILLNKLSNAIEKLVTKNPTKDNFTCNELASTGKITYSECQKIYNKKFATIIPTNTAVENSIATDVNTLNANKTKNKIIISAVTNEIAPNSKVEKELVQLVQTQKTKRLQNPAAQEAKMEKTIRQIKKYHIRNIAKIANVRARRIISNIMNVAHNRYIHHNNDFYMNNKMPFIYRDNKQIKRQYQERLKQIYIRNYISDFIPFSANTGENTENKNSNIANIRNKRAVSSFNFFKFNKF